MNNNILIYGVLFLCGYQYEKENNDLYQDIIFIGFGTKTKQNFWTYGASYSWKNQHREKPSE